MLSLKGIISTDYTSNFVINCEEIREAGYIYIYIFKEAGHNYVSTLKDNSL